MYAMIYSRFPKGFQRVYRYLYFPFPKRLIIRHYTVSDLQSARATDARAGSPSVSVSHRVAGAAGACGGHPF